MAILLKPIFWRKSGRLNAVIDFRCVGIGDQACVDIPRPASREQFRSAVGLDLAACAGLGIWKALITLVPLRDTDSVKAKKARQDIGDIFDDHSQAARQSE